MSIATEINDMHDLAVDWRHTIHAHPETAFTERRTADLVAENLETWGIDVHRGLAGTGLVGTLRKGTGDRVVGLRADLDALFIHEANDVPYRSAVDGKMHACGHDGHIAMLLGAAKYLAEKGAFDGTVRFIFQPAEETGDQRCGGNLMVQEGLFEDFPVDAVFGMHNLPGLPVGQFAVRPGPMMASIDTFEFKVFSDLNHPATQHESPDPLLTAANIVQEIHAYKARRVNPADPLIVSITQFQVGDPINDKQGVHVLPPEAYVRGTVYTLNDDLRDQIEEAIGRIVGGMAAAAGTDSHYEYQRGYPVLVNTDEHWGFAVQVASAVVGEENVDAEMQPLMAAEDFAFMLKHRPGCYVFVGNGEAVRNGQPYHLHNPHYDFNDEVLPVGTQYWVTLVEEFLKARPEEGSPRAIAS